MTAPIEIRLVTPDEWQALRSVRLEAMRDSPEAFGSTYERELSFDEDGWRQRISRGPWWLAWRADRPVAMAAGFAAEGTPRTWHLVSMWVEPSSRRSGLGSDLVEVVAEWAEGEGAPVLSLGVASGNENAKRLYEKTGFSFTGESEPLQRDAHERELVMERQLDR